MKTFSAVFQRGQSEIRYGSSDSFIDRSVSRERMLQSATGCYLTDSSSRTIRTFVQLLINFNLHWNLANASWLYVMSTRNNHRHMSARPMPVQPPRILREQIRVFFTCISKTLAEIVNLTSGRRQTRSIVTASQTPECVCWYARRRPSSTTTCKNSFRALVITNREQSLIKRHCV